MTSLGFTRQIEWRIERNLFEEIAQILGWTKEFDVTFKICQTFNKISWVTGPNTFVLCFNILP